MFDRGLSLGAYIINICVLLLLFSTMIFFLGTQGRIVIERPYYEEYIMLHAQYEELEQSKVPQCPEVKCRDSPMTWIYGVSAIFVFFGSIFFSSRKEKQLKQREDKLAKAEENFSKRKK